MIHLKVVKSTDPNAQGTYQYQFDVLTLGRSAKNDLILKETNIPRVALLLTIEDKVLFLQTLHADWFCYVNNKKVSGKKLIKTGDTLTIGETTIEIFDYQKSEQSLNVSKLYENFVEKNPNHQFILDILDNEIQKLENQK